MGDLEQKFFRKVKPSTNTYHPTPQVNIDLDHKRVY